MKINKIIEWIMIIVVVLTIPLLVVMSQKEYKLVPMLLIDNKMLSFNLIGELDSNTKTNLTDMTIKENRLEIPKVKEIISQETTEDRSEELSYKIGKNFAKGVKAGVRGGLSKILGVDNKILVEDLLKNLSQSEDNNNFKELFATKTIMDTVAQALEVEVLSVDKIPYKNIIEGISYTTSFKQSIYRLNKDTNRSDFKSENEIEVSYNNDIYELSLKNYSFPLNFFIYYCLLLIIPLIVFLFPALKRNTDLHWYFKFIFLLFLIRTLIRIISLGQSSCLELYLFENSIIFLVIITLILSFFSKMLKTNRFFTWSILIISLLNVWLQYKLLIWILGLVFLIIIIKSERGVNKRFYKKYIYFFLIYMLTHFVMSLPLSIATVFLSFSSISPNLSSLEAGFINFIESLYSLGLFQFSLYYSLFVLILYRLVKINIVVMERLFKYILIIFLPFYLFQGLIYYIDIFNSSVRNLIVLQAFFISFFCVIKFIKIFPVLNPVRFSLKKKIIQFLNRSYGFTESQKYSAYLVDYLKKLNKKYKVGFLTESSVMGDKFEEFTFQNAREMINLSAEPIPILNIDIELLNDTAIGKQLQYIENNDMPHLLFPIYNDKKQLQAVIAFGKFPGISWQKSLVDAILKLVEVFTGFYLNFLTQEGYIQQEKVIIKEQEERLYNQKLWEVETKKNEELEAERQHIMKSMEYASLIQKSILPQSQEMLVQFPEHFVIWQQRDIVGGDLYWLHPIPDSNEVIFSVIDCTGHGVPGALMSVASNSALEQLVQENSNYNPGRLLSNLHQSVGNTLHQAEMNTQQDGMDMSIIKYNKNNKGLSFAGANHNLILIKGKTQELIRVRGDRYSIGGLKWKNEIKFNQHDLELESGDTIYLFSDGVVDQPFQHSETKLSRLGSKVWHDFLVENNQQSMEDVKASIEKLIDEMRVSSPQRDDICIVGIRV